MRAYKSSEGIQPLEAYRIIGRVWGDVKWTFWERFLRVWTSRKWTFLDTILGGFDPWKRRAAATRSEPRRRTENGAIWSKLRPKSILAEAHFWPQGSSGSWLGYDMAPSGLWGDSGVHFPRFWDPFSEQMGRNAWRVVQNQASRNSLAGLSEFTSQIPRIQRIQRIFPKWSAAGSSDP